MAVGATGDRVIGTVAGLKKGLKGSTGDELQVPNKLIYIADADPNGVVTSTTGSDIIFDVVNGYLYIGDIDNGVGGSSWISIGSQSNP